MAEKSAELPHPDPAAKSAACFQKQPRESILNLLQQAGTSLGVFATSGDCPPAMAMPGLFVDGIGMIGLPLSETAAPALVEKCRHAKANTSDTTSLSFKEMDSNECSIRNTEWQTLIQTLATRVCREKLGVVPEIKVQAVMDKLVVLGQGAMYSHQQRCLLQHGDEGMANNSNTTFGTLIVTLPSSFQGGKMVVKNHAGYQETVFSSDGESLYKSRYSAFYNDCELSECHPITDGHCLCFVYNLQVLRTECDNTRPPQPLPCAASNNRFTILEQLRAEAVAWNAQFDGNKLVIMVDHLRQRRGSNFNGDDKAIIDLLKLADKEGVGLAWCRGSVNYRIYGYGMGRYGDFEWNGANHSKMTLNVCRKGLRLDDWDNEEEDETKEQEGDDTDGDGDDDDKWGIFGDDYEDEFNADDDYDNGDVTLDAIKEMVPSNFYDSETPTEDFNATYHGVMAKRNYEIQKAIVVWPKESSWLVLTNGELDKMCRFVLKDPNVSRADMLANQILAKEFEDYGFNNDRKSVVSTFMQVLMAVGDSDGAFSFWELYLAKQQMQGRLPNEIVQQIGSFMEHFGNEDRVQVCLYETIRKEMVVRNPNAAIDFVSGCVNSLKNDHTNLCQLMVDRLLASMDRLQSTVNASSAKAFLTMIEADCGIPDSAKLVSTFLDCVTQSSCELPSSDSATRRSKIETRGPVVLLTSGLPGVCSALGWQGVEKSLRNVISKLIEYGSVVDALTLVKELSGPHPERLDRDGKQFKLCASLASRAIQPSIQAAVENPSMQVLSHAVTLADAFCPSTIDSIVCEILKMDLDEIIAPLALVFRKQENASPQLQSAVNKLSSRCVEQLTARNSAPMGDVINWSLSLTAETELNKKNIDAFLCSPCKSSLSFELAKYSHEKILADLKPLVASGYITAYPSRPSGNRRWSIQIDKLQSHRQSVTSIPGVLSCSCRPFEVTNGSCIIASSIAKMDKRHNDESILKQFVAASAIEATQRKRKQEYDADLSTSGESKKTKGPQKSEKSAGAVTHDEVIVID